MGRNLDRRTIRPGRQVKRIKKRNRCNAPVSLFSNFALSSARRQALVGRVPEVGVVVYRVRARGIAIIPIAVRAFCIVTRRCRIRRYAGRRIRRYTGRWIRRHAGYIGCHVATDKGKCDEQSQNQYCRFFHVSLLQKSYASRFFSMTLLVGVIMFSMPKFSM